MLINNTLVYAQEYKIEIGRPGKNLYYFFDYDERSYSINMEFQHFHQFYEMCIFLDDKAGHLIDGSTCAAATSSPCAPPCSTRLFIPRDSPTSA